MFSGFIIPFRESLEAGVVVGLLLSILFVFKAQENQKYVWYGVCGGIVCSLLFAWFFNIFMGGFEGRSEKLYEGILMFIACGLITHMVFWMKSFSVGLRNRMKNQVEVILKKKTLYMLAGISFFAVVREGVETVIFFRALDVSFAAPLSFLPALLGVIAAVLVSYFVFKGSTWLSEKIVFQWSGVLLLFIAGGLLAHGIVEFQGAGLFPIFIKPLFDFSNILNENNGFGALLKALFGYDANPSLFAFVVYIIFIPLTIWKYRQRPV